MGSFAKVGSRRGVGRGGVAPPPPLPSASDREIHAKRGGRAPKWRRRCAPDVGGCSLPPPPSSIQEWRYVRSACGRCPNAHQPSNSGETLDACRCLYDGTGWETGRACRPQKAGRKEWVEDCASGPLRGGGTGQACARGVKNLPLGMRTRRFDWFVAFGAAGATVNGHAQPCVVLVRRHTPTLTGTRPRDVLRHLQRSGTSGRGCQPDPVLTPC